MFAASEMISIINYFQCLKEVCLQSIKMKPEATTAQPATSQTLTLLSIKESELSSQDVYNLVCGLCVDQLELSSVKLCYNGQSYSDLKASKTQLF